MRKDAVWHNRTGGYIETTSPTGYDIVINGTSRYLNFNLISGATGYGFRDNAGTMQFKNSAGAWVDIGSGGGTGTVTSVAMSVPTGLTISGSPITTTGTLAVALNTGYVIPLQSTLDALAPLISPTFATSITGSYLTASEMIITNASKQIISAPVATYPSLTELTYLKGVTSAIQTQINTKQATITFGTGVQTALGVNIGSAGAFVVNNTTETIIGLKTMSGLNVITHSSVGTILRNPANTFSYTLTAAAIVADRILNLPLITGTDTLGALGLAQTWTATQTFVAPVLGTPASGILTNATGLPITGLVSSTTQALGVGSIELGHATDTTISRVSAGVIAVEGVNVALITTASTATTCTFNGGGGTSVSITIQMQKVGNMVSLFIPVVTATTGTGSTSLVSNTAIPVGFRPAAYPNCPITIIMNNGANVDNALGIMLITPTGFLEFYRAASTPAFTNSATAGSNAAMVASYYVA